VRRIEFIEMLVGAYRDQQLHENNQLLETGGFDTGFATNAQSYSTTEA